MAHAVTVFVLVVFIAACQSGITPRVDKLQSWTKQLRAEQPDDAFAAIYARRQQKLLFIGAKHSLQSDSLTFRLIEEGYALLKLDTLIAEGFRYSDGANAERLMNWLTRQREVDGFVAGGEAVPASRGMLAQGGNVFGGEPDDTDIREYVLADGFTAEDLLGFYTLRSIPQWIRERKILDAADNRARALLTGELERNRERLMLPGSVLADVGAWEHWYTQVNGKPFGASFESEETGPLADGRYGSNKVAASISRARDAFLLRIIAQHWNNGENIVVVFGRSHLMIVQPALNAMLGPPCYVGDSIASAPAACLSVH